MSCPDSTLAVPGLYAPFVALTDGSPNLPKKLRQNYSRVLADWMAAADQPEPPGGLLSLHDELLAASDPILAASYDAAFGELRAAYAEEREPAAFACDTSGYYDRGGRFTRTKAPIADAWKKALAGDLIRLLPGNFSHETLGARVRTPGVRLRGSPGRSSILLPNPVGGSDTLLFGVGLDGIELSHMTLRADDRGTIKTGEDATGKPCAHNVLLRCLDIFGDGDAFTAGWKNAAKWAIQAYNTGKWLIEDVVVWSIFLEHVAYLHNIQGDHTLRRVSARHFGRTFLQIVNRKNEGLEGFGNILVQDCDAEDGCLEGGGGGSLLTFRGGMPTSDVVIERFTARLGCNELLAKDFQDSITGVLLMDSAGPSQPGKGDEAWDGGTGALHVIDPDWEVGTKYGGKGSAIRPLAKIGAVEFAELVFTGSKPGRMIRRGVSTPVALEVFNSAKRFKIRGDPTEFEGQVYYQGRKYGNYSAFKADPLNEGVFTP